MTEHQIIIKGLQLSVHIGVTARERKKPQVLEADLWITPAVPFDQMRDKISKTVDYAAVVERIKKLAAEKPRKLIETLADEIADCVVGEFKAPQVTVEIRKRILPDVAYVAVCVEKSCPIDPDDFDDIPF